MIFILIVLALAFILAYSILRFITNNFFYDDYKHVEKYIEEEVRPEDKLSFKVKKFMSEIKASLVRFKNRIEHIIKSFKKQ